ncbi:MAG: alpha/beta hydrolase [candidate division WOR-3 bacterium]|nr:MAG: alpha/beta hydrolase [candidate division WOR-3 bacterium]UCF06925.1 MAG: alpha/beta hydrolase [bacterium]
MKNIQFKDGRNEYDIVVENIRLNVLCDFKPDAKNLMIFLHGLACSRDTFRDLFAHDYFQGYSMLLPDLVGFGRSDKPDSFSYTMEAQADLCERVMNQFPDVTIQVVAHSMGGAIGLLFSAEQVERMDAFVNIEGNLISEDCGMLSRGIADVSLRDYRERIFEEHRERFSNDTVLQFDQTTPVAVHRSARSMVEWSDNGELLRRFKQLPCRTSYFWGEKNHDMPILQRLEGIEKCMIHDSGHGMMVENPREFYSKLAEFLMA